MTTSRRRFCCDEDLARLGYDGLSARAADEAHRAGEDDRVAARSADYPNPEEVGEARVAGAVKAALLPGAIVLRRLDEGDPRLVEVRNRDAQVAGIDDVVGIDHANDVDVVGKVLTAPVERSGLVAGQGRRVREQDAGSGLSQPLTLLLNRPPERLAGGVIVDHLDDQSRIVDGDQRAERLDHQIRRLVVGWKLQGDHRPAHRIRWPRRSLGLCAERINHLEGGGDDQPQGCQLQSEQYEAEQQTERAVSEQQRRAGQVDRIDGGGANEAGEEQRAHGPPPSW